MCLCIPAQHISCTSLTSNKYFSLYYYFPDVTCATLPEVGPHVIMKGTSVTFGSNLTFTCIDGYQLNGSSISTCNGTWNVTDVECEGNLFLSALDPYCPLTYLLGIPSSLMISDSYSGKPGSALRGNSCI